MEDRRKKELETRINQLKQIIAEENQKESIRYVYLFVVYSELEQLENELKQIENKQLK